MVQVLISVDFLEYFQKFNSFTIANFKESQEIDLESFSFIHTLLFTNKSEWSLNISLDEIIIFKDINSVIDNEKQIIAKIVRSFRNNIIKSAKKEYHLIYTQDYSAIDRSRLPPYIFLGNVEKSICDEIERELGVIVISSKNMKIEEKKRGVIFKSIKNTEDAFFKELEGLIFNKIKIEDQYFSKNCVTFLLKQKPLIVKKSMIELFIKTNNSHGGHKLSDQENSLKINLPSTCKVTMENGCRHDRNIFTNTFIITIGNSLFASNTACNYSQYPIGIYSDYFG